MVKRFQPGVPELPDSTVAAVKGMLLRGDRMVDIGLWWSISSSTVHGIKKGKVRAYRPIAPAQPEQLPPRGPYVVVAKQEHDETRAAAASRDRLIADLTGLLDSYRRMGSDHVAGS